jgi:hypothetical protein
MAKVYGRKLVNGAAARHVETQNALRRETRQVEGKARSNLSAARSSTEWEKIADPGHLTSIGSAKGVGKYGNVDYVVYMEAYKQGAMALEFGHAPSGVFGPGGSLSHVKTRAPSGLYILTRAAGLGAKMSMSSGRKRGKR